MKEEKSIRLDGDLAYVTLNKGYETVIDAADLPLAISLGWKVNIRPRSNYVIAHQKQPCGKWKSAYLHRILMSAPSGLQVDHINGDGLDNRRCNLRLATRNQNQHNQRLRKDNTSGLKGACWHSKYNRWCAQIAVNRKQKFLGFFDSAEEAHNAYRKASEKLHREFGRCE